MARLQTIFNRILTGETVFGIFADKVEYNSARTSLLRKYKAHKELMDSLGTDSPYENRYLQCTFNPADLTGSFKLEEDQRKYRLSRKQYNIKDI